MSGVDWGSGSNYDVGGWLRNHPHRVAVVFIALFLLLALISLFTDRRAFAVFLILLAGTVYLVWTTPQFLRKQQVIDRWDMVIPGGNGQAAVVMDATQTHIDEMNPPNVDLRFTDLAPGMIRSLRGDTRPFLIVQNVTNGRLKPYFMFVNVRDYGDTLQTS